MDYKSALIQIALMNASYSCDNWKIFFTQIYHYPEVWRSRHIAVFFETSVLKEVRILHQLSPQWHYNAGNTKGPQKSFYPQIC